jgi:hypothetical protein
MEIFTMADQIVINTSALQDVGDNVKAVQQGSLLVIVIDTTHDIGVSSTGKMIGKGSTGGFASLPGNLKGNIYVGRKV